MSPPAANGHATPKTRRSKDSAEEESSPGTTRYSRAVKMRSPNILEDDSPKVRHFSAPIVKIFNRPGNLDFLICF